MIATIFADPRLLLCGLPFVGASSWEHSCIGHSWAKTRFVVREQIRFVVREQTRDERGRFSK